MAHGASAPLDWYHPRHVLICQNAEPARYTHYCLNNTNILGPARDTHVVGVSALIRPGALMQNRTVSGGKTQWSPTTSSSRIGTTKWPASKALGSVDRLSSKIGITKWPASRASGASSLEDDLFVTFSLLYVLALMVVLPGAAVCKSQAPQMKVGLATYGAVGYYSIS